MIVNQPHDKQLGVQIIEALENDKYSLFTIMVAYAKLSGVYRLLPYIRKFRKKGGRVRTVVGVDQSNTTYDALCVLLKETDELSVFHSEALSQTFHIKCYWLKGENSCWYAIGSNNLTAGGLFSNYELCNIETIEGVSASASNSSLEILYRTYVNDTSVCSHKATPDFLSQLLNQRYVLFECHQRKSLADAIKASSKIDNQTKLFGKEVFPTPKLPAEYRKQGEKTKKPRAVKKNKNAIQQYRPETIERYEGVYLIRHVPKAGGRSKQVHFTIDLLDKYFCLDPGDDVLFQEMLPSGEVGEIEQRQIVYSKSNGNVKIELAGAEILDTMYPEDKLRRPVLVIKRVNTNLYVYMLLMDGNHGYESINTRLLALPQRRSLPYEVIDESAMFSLWNECPIL